MKAVVFVDVQKDFIDGALKNDKAIEVTPNIVEFAKECVQKGYKLYATRDTHEKTQYDNPQKVQFEVLDNNFEDIGLTKEFIAADVQHTLNSEFNIVPKSGYLTTLEGKKLPVEHCVEGTDGWMIDNRLMEVLDGNCTFINKPTFGSFDLVEIMNEDLPEWHGKNVWTKGMFDEIIICGFCTDICVISNALLLRAKFPNTNITVMKDLCAGVTEESHNAALKVLEMQQIDIK